MHIKGVFYEKKSKKLVSALLITAMSVVMLTGCGEPDKETKSGKNSSAGNSSETSKEDAGSGEVLTADTSEHVDLTMYLIGDRTPDFNEVYGEINKILEEKLNCSLNVEFLSWGEHDKKYSLLFSSQENFEVLSEVH